MKNFILSVSYVFFCVFSINSCTIYKVPKQITVSDHFSNGSRNPELSFKGIRQSINQLDNNETLNVLLVHGMNTKLITDFDKMVTNLEVFLNLEKAEIYEYNLAVNHDDVISRENSPQIKIFQCKDKTATNINRYVKFIYIHWSPALKEYKEFVINADLPAQNKRAQVNRKLKDFIVNDGFSDVVGFMKEDVQLKVYKAFEIATLLQYIPLDQKVIDLNNIEYNDNPLLLISGSLGSKITFEFIANYTTYFEEFNKLLNDCSPDKNCNIVLKSNNDKPDITLTNYPKTRKLGTNLLNKKYQWYLLSNQLPLLDGVNFSFTNFEEFMDADDPLLIQNFIENLGENKVAIAKNTTIISFYDPNDCLGFRIPGVNQNGYPYSKELYNISIPVQRSSFVGIADPNKAHVGSKKDPYVLHMISNGWSGNTKDFPKKGKLKKKLID